MKLLFDANISRRIVAMLDDIFPGSTHVSLAGFPGETADEIIWEFAKRMGFAIVTADVDFVNAAQIKGAPPKVIRPERMDYSIEVAATLIRHYALAITGFGKTTKARMLLRRN